MNKNPLPDYATPSAIHSQRLFLKRLCCFAAMLFINMVVHAQPVISSLSNYSANPGATITITGTGFNPTAANNIVLFGATRGTVSSASGTALSVVVPPCASFSLVSVSNTATSLTGYSPKPFSPSFDHGTYTPALYFGTRTFLDNAPFMPTDGKIADLDGDGKPEIIIVRDGGISIYRNTSAAGLLIPASFTTTIDLTCSGILDFTIADLDGDGKPEIIVAKSSIVIFKNNITSGSFTAASFGSPITLTGLNILNGVRVSDIDGDGKPDIIAKSAEENGCNIFKNIFISSLVGSPSFASPVYFASGFSTYMEIADFDGDHKPDILFAGIGSIALLKNTATSGTISSTSFNSPFTISAIEALDIKTGDLDGDGKPEIIIMGTSGNTVSVLRNTTSTGPFTSSSFATAVNFSSGSNSVNIDLGDMDGDGKLDMVVVNTGDYYTGLGAHVSILRNISTTGSIVSTSFADLQKFNVYVSQSNLVVGDLDGDGRPDVTVIGTFGYGASVLAVMQGQTPAPVINSISPAAAIPGTSVTITGSNFSTSLSTNLVRFGATRGTVTAASRTSLTVTVPIGASYRSVTVDNDSISLAGTTSFPFLPVYNNSAYVPDTVNLMPRKDIATTAGARAVAMGDMDGDGKPDMVVVTASKISIFKNMAISGVIDSSTFATEVSFPISYSASNRVRLSDIDGDGKLDVVVGTDAQTLYIYRNTVSTPGVINSSSLATGVLFNFGTTSAEQPGTLFNVGDLDGDGKPDILITNPWDGTGVSVIRNISVRGTINTNSFQSPQIIRYSGGYMLDVIECVLRDMNSDGKVDIVMLYPNAALIVWNNTTIGSILGESSPFFGTDASFYDLPGAPLSFYDATLVGNDESGFYPYHALTVEDIDRDGLPDIVLAATDGLAIFRNQSTPTIHSFGDKVAIATGISLPVIAFNDMDGDAKPDIVLYNWSDNYLTVLRNKSVSGSITTGSFSGPNGHFITPALSDYLDMGTQDIDGDGKPDVMMATGQSFVSLFRNDPLSISGGISGPLTLCAGSSVALSSSMSGGSWSSSNASVATIGTATGVVTGIGAGTTIISYTTSGGTSTAIVTVNPLPNAGTITVASSVCQGASVTASSSGSAGGTWSSSNPAAGTINAVTGSVTGISGGTTTISYTVTNGCGTATATHAMMVAPLPVAGTISGTASVCAGSTTTLSSSGTGGTWSSSNAAVGSVSASGVVAGLGAGTTTISYTVSNSCGSATATKVVTVNPLSVAGTITGASLVNVGATITLSDAVSGGSWSASNGNATVSSGGVVTGVTAGTVVISYTVTGSCGTATATTIIAVDISMGGITGTLAACVGGTTTLSGPVAGGWWGSSNLAVATVTTSGVVNGIAAGTATITYSAGGSYVAAVVTVNPLPAAIAGAVNVCLGATTTLTDAATAGTWSSNNSSIASVGAGTGIVSGMSVATTIITYTLPTGCYRTLSMTVKPLPAAITGAGNVCVGGTATYTDATTGGLSWTSSNASVATIGASSGVLTAVSAGTTIVTYTLLSGCIATKIVTVAPLPAAISGASIVCTGSTAILTDADGGGTWTSSNTSVATVGSATGVVTGIATGAAYIIYTTGAGCIASKTITVNPLPAVITGGTILCAGTTTALTDATTGGTWSSGSAGAATISASGVVTGTGAGTSVISYTIGTGCARTTTVTVTGTLSPNVGTPVTCVGSTTMFGNSTPGGTWTCSSPAVATVSSAGLVTGVNIGTSNITYTISVGCRAINTVTVNASMPAITGTGSVCVNATTALADATAGGIWSSSNPLLGTVSASGVVTGIAAGTVTITYALPAGCYRIMPVVVKALPGAISGNMGICTGATSTLTDVSGISWASSTPSVATVGATSGVVTGIAAGTAIITFTATTGCTTTAVVTVDAAPSIAAIAGPSSVAVGHSITLADATAGGVWSSSNTANATITSSGVVTAIAAPAVTISYTVTSGVCIKAVTKTMTITAARIGSEVTIVEADISVYPNPTTGKFTVMSSCSGLFTVYTLEGKEALRTDIIAGTNMLSLPKELAAGIYMGRFRGNDRSTMIVRLVYEP